MTEETTPRWLTWQELCLELRLDPKDVRKLVKRGRIVGICHGRPSRYQSDWRYLDPSPKYKQALQTMERVFTHAYDIDLLNQPLLSSTDFAAIAGLDPITIRTEIYKGHLKPAGKLGGYYSLFTVEQLREFLLRRERKEPTMRRARCELLVDWCIDAMRRRPVETMTREEVRDDDRLEKMLRRLMALREPERSMRLKEFWRRYELARDVAALLVREEPPPSVPPAPAGTVPGGKLRARKQRIQRRHLDKEPR